MQEVNVIYFKSEWNAIFTLCFATTNLNFGSLKKQQKQQQQRKYPWTSNYVIIINNSIIITKLHINLQNKNDSEAHLKYNESKMSNKHFMMCHRKKWLNDCNVSISYYLPHGIQNDYTDDQRGEGNVVIQQKNTAVNFHFNRHLCIGKSFLLGFFFGIAWLTHRWGLYL